MFYPLVPRALAVVMSPNLNPADASGGRQFKPEQVDAEAGCRIAAETGNGFEFWWIRCSGCLEIFGAVVGRTVLGAACAHCNSLQLVTLQEREEVRTWRRQQAGPN